MLRQGALAGGLDEAAIATLDTLHAAWSAGIARGDRDTMVVILTERSEDALRLCGR